LKPEWWDAPLVQEKYQRKGNMLRGDEKDNDDADDKYLQLQAEKNLA
jgi:hypothetical protein